MTALYLILLVLAAACFFFAALGRSFNRGEGRTFNLVALGLFFWTLVPLIQTARNLG